MPLDEVPRIAEERPSPIASIVANPEYDILVALRIYGTMSYYSAAKRVFGLDVEAWQRSPRHIRDIVWHTLLDLEDMHLVSLHCIGTIYRTDGVEEPIITAISDATRRYTKRYELTDKPMMEDEEDGRKKSNRWKHKITAGIRDV